MKKQLLVIDGSSFLYRAYYSMRPLHTPNGQPVNAVYGFCRMIKKLIGSFKPQHVVLVWDSRGKTVRHEMYDQYKATRQAPPSDLFDQKKLILEFTQLIGMHQVAHDGVEADDLIGTLAHKFAQRDYEVIVITSDKDLCQLLGERITIFDPFKDTHVTRESFETEKKIPVSKLTFYYALVGDASDNIPGVKGIGPKNALDLVTQFKTLEDLYENISRVASQRVRTALETNKTNAFLSQDLFTLRTIPSNTSEQDIVFTESNWIKAQPFFERLQFTSLLKELSAGNTQQTITPFGPLSTPLHEKYRFTPITTRQALIDLTARLAQAPMIALDTETDSLHPLQSTLVGLSLCMQEGEAFYLPLKHKTEQEQLSLSDVQEILGPLFADSERKKILHHAKFDQLVLQHAGLPLRGVAFDTMVAASLIVPDGQRVGLKALSQSYFDERMLTFSDVVEKNKYPKFTHVPVTLATQYAAADAHQTFKLWRVFAPHIKDSSLQTLYETIEHPLIEVLCAMETEGIACNAELLGHMDKELTKALSELDTEIHALTGSMPGTINLNSPKQLEQLLFGQLKLPPQKKKKTGYSTDQEVLQALADLHVVPRLILKYREWHKLKSTYVSALPQAILPETGKIHTSFNQISVATGRLASTEPNLQNIPVQTGPVTVRSAFYAPDNHVFISADYSQIELRVLAYLAQDQTLIDAFKHDRDIHTQTAATLFDVHAEQITHEQRQIGKRINFSILYGQTPFGLARELNIPASQAKIYIDKYFAQYPSVRDWMAAVIEQTKQTGYTSTLWGRKRFVPGIKEKNKNLFEAACRIAVNTWAQGTAAEIMKLGMIRLHEQFKTQKLGARIILQIHDELLISVPHEELQPTQQLVQKTLETVVDWNVPLKVTVRSGKTWQEVTK